MKEILDKTTGTIFTNLPLDLTHIHRPPFISVCE
jgi:hypothetical protein